MIHYPNDTALLTGSIHKHPFFLKKTSQLWHNRRHLEITVLRFAFNRFRAASRSTFFSLAGLFSNSFSTAALSLSPSPSSSSSPPPSPGQLLIRGRNDRCFAHQQCRLFCLRTNSRCAVHIYFRSKKKNPVGKKKWLKKNKTHLFAHLQTPANKHIFSVNSFHHCDEQSRLKHNRFSSTSCLCLCLSV